MSSTIHKSRADAPDGFFEAEAAGLRWLAEAESTGGARIARVIAVEPGAIELERIAEARPTPETARAFGAALAATHASGADYFGAAPRGGGAPLFIGRRPLPPTSAADGRSWGAFYARDRVMPYLESAERSGTIGMAERALVEEACDLIASGAFDDGARAARIHGDLWNGNVLWSPDGVVLIDPAAHGGHPETDLAMLALFGCPYLGEIVEGYSAAAPLAEGWRRRIPLHQLHPLAVHAAGHGPAYGPPLVDAARTVLALG